MSKVFMPKKIFIKKFNNKIFNFKKIIASKLLNENVLPKGKRIKLNKLHKFLNIDEVEIAYNRIYDEFRSKKFQKLYDKFCKKIIKDNKFDKNIRYQAIPSARIHMPGMNTVNFHNDSLYGHGKKILNFWVPLTEIDKSNSLQIVDEKNSKALINEFKKNKSSIIEMNFKSRKKSKPLKMNFGEYLVFNSTVIHGAEINKTEQTRVSFDFRMVNQNDDIGVKDKSFFIKVGERNLKNKKKRTACYVSKPKNNTYLPSQKYQQIICNQYCTDQNLNPVLFETELSGFDYYPVLNDLIKGSWKNYYEHLVVFSINNFPKNKKRFNQILKKIKQKGKTLHFVLEEKI